MKPNITYRKRRDLMLKKFSTTKILDELTEVTRRKGLVIIYLTVLLLALLYVLKEQDFK